MRMPPGPSRGRPSRARLRRRAAPCGQAGGLALRRGKPGARRTALQADGDPRPSVTSGTGQAVSALGGACPSADGSRVGTCRPVARPIPVTSIGGLPSSMVPGGRPGCDDGMFSEGAVPVGAGSGKIACRQGGSSRPSSWETGPRSVRRHRRRARRSARSRGRLRGLPAVAPGRAMRVAAWHRVASPRSGRRAPPCDLGRHVSAPDRGAAARPAAAGASAHARAAAPAPAPSSPDSRAAGSAPRGGFAAAGRAASARHDGRNGAAG